MKKGNLITILIIMFIIILAYFIINRQHPETPNQVAECIGKNSILYIQLGCHACENQEDMFGENYQYLNKIDCFYERNKCDEITATPTWKIKGEFYEGVQSIKKLKELTGCD
ncbi:MAG: hypothetical protein ABH811_02945 [archaeon]